MQFWKTLYFYEIFGLKLTLEILSYHPHRIRRPQDELPQLSSVTGGNSTGLGNSLIQAG